MAKASLSLVKYAIFALLISAMGNASNPVKTLILFYSITRVLSDVRICLSSQLWALDGALIKNTLMNS